MADKLLENVEFGVRSVIEDKRRWRPCSEHSVGGRKTVTNIQETDEL